MVAAVCGWHEHHVSAREEIERRLRRTEAMIVAAPALVEAYSVLTRLPPPHRLAPADAVAVLDASFMRAARIVTLNGGAYRRLLREAPASGIAGGRVYDAVIAACVLTARETALLTFNAAHFRLFEASGLEVVVPGS